MIWVFFLLVANWSTNAASVLARWSLCTAGSRLYKCRCHQEQRCACVFNTPSRTPRQFPARLSLWLLSGLRRRDQECGTTWQHGLFCLHFSWRLIDMTARGNWAERSLFFRSCAATAVMTPSVFFLSDFCWRSYSAPSLVGSFIQDSAFSRRHSVQI